MGLGIPSFRMTADDLPDADKKSKRALEPLLAALSLTLNAVVSALNGFSLPALKATTFTTAANGAAYVALGLGGPVQDIWVSGLTPADGSTLDSVYSMSSVPTSAGATLLFVGLAPLTTYNVRVRYLS